MMIDESVNYEKVLTEPKQLVAVELKKQGFDINKISMPQTVFLLADDIFDKMKDLNCGKYQYPVSNGVWIFNHNSEVGFVKAEMCSPAIATQAEDLIATGVKELIHIGYAGGLQESLQVGDIVITEGAFNDTAIARLYGYDTDFMETSKELTDKIKHMITGVDLSVIKGKSWTTDAGYHETLRQVLEYRKKSALCVEMEGVGLFTIAKYRNCKATALYIVSDVFSKDEWQLGWDGEVIAQSVDFILKQIVKAI